MAGQSHNPALLGLDIGTTNCKLIAYSADGHILAEATEGYELHHPQPGFVELEPADIMSAVSGLLHAIAPAIADCTDLSLAISAQGEAFVLVDTEGNPLTSVPVSMDMRGCDLIAEFSLRPEVQNTRPAAGQTLNALTSLAKILWFRKEMTEVFEQCAQVLCVGEYVLRQMGLSPAMDYSMASRTGLFDNTRLQWAWELVALADLPETLFPPVVQSGTPLGTITAEIARNYGLNQPVRVIAGGHDQVCAMLGAGVTTAETGLYSIGTTEAIALTMDGYHTDQFAEKAPPYPHVIPGKYVALMGSQSGGRLLDWFKKLRGISDINALLADVPDLPSCVTVLPHFAGSGSMLGDENAHGIFTDLSFQTTPQDLTHAVLEGISMEQALALKQSCDLGHSVKRLRAVGGGSRSGKWMQIKADMTGLPIDCMDNPETACAGAAMLAGLGSGALKSLDAALTCFAHSGKAYHPRQEYTEIYREKLNLYRNLYNSQKTHQTQQKALVEQIGALRAKLEDKG